MLKPNLCEYCFFLSVFSFANIHDLQEKGKVISGEGEGYLFNSSQPLQPASQTISQTITAESSSPPHIGNTETGTSHLWF